MEQKKKLTIEKLIEEAQLFCLEQSKFQHKELYGVTDGKAVGTLIEHKFLSRPKQFARPNKLQTFYNRFRIRTRHAREIVTAFTRLALVVA